MNPNDFSTFYSAVMIFRTMNVSNLYRPTRNLDIIFILLLTRLRTAESMLFVPWHNRQLSSLPRTGRPVRRRSDVRGRTQVSVTPPPGPRSRQSSPVRRGPTKHEQDRQ